MSPFEDIFDEEGEIDSEFIEMVVVTVATAVVIAYGIWDLYQRIKHRDY